MSIKQILRFSLFLFFLLDAASVFGQEKGEDPKIPQKEEDLRVPEKVEVKPFSADEEIAKRLQNILQATGWFERLNIKVDEGVVFLNGKTGKEEHKKWAGDLARRTEDVVAVVNKISVKPSIWDYSKAIEGIRSLWSRIVQAIPSIVFGILILAAAWILARLIALGSRILLHKRLENPLLRKLASRAIGFFVFLLGVYIVFEVAGLTAVAFTILGGTGVLGIILGIAFRDITENILASIFLSVQNPFNKGDLIEIEGTVGFVQSLTMRATVLLSLEGNHVQIPNAKIYKGNIKNYTSHPNRREDFIIGIGYSDSIPKAQDAALQVLSEHPAVLKSPEPWVLVESLGRSTVNLRVYFWLNGSQHNWLKVRSSVIRLIKKSLLDEGITLPDEGRERIFPQNLSVELVSPKKEGIRKKHPLKEEEQISTDAESGLYDESREIQKEASRFPLPEEGENLL